MEDLGQVVNGYISDELRSEIKVGKIRIPWKEINHAMESLNIKLIGKKAKNINNMLRGRGW